MPFRRLASLLSKKLRLSYGRTLEFIAARLLSPCWILQSCACKELDPPSTDLPATRPAPSYKTSLWTSPRMRPGYLIDSTGLVTTTSLIFPTFMLICTGLGCDMVTAVPTGQRAQMSVDCYTFVVLKTKQQKRHQHGV